MAQGVGGLPALQQQRARHAWESVTSWRTDGGSYPPPATEYAREAKKLPMRIRSAGLGQALSFLLAKAKGKKPSLTQLHGHLSQWVIKERGLRGERPGHLLESIVHGDVSFLRRATEESLAWLEWLNRFAEAEGLSEADGG